MSYYVLPKKHNTININPKLLEYDETNDEFNMLKPVVSQSLVYYLSIVTQQITDYFDSSTCDSIINYDMICKIINPYEFIFSKVPGLKYSVSKLKPQNNIFFIIMEIMYNFSIFEYMNKNINTIHLGKNSHSIIECMNIMREDYNDNHIFFELNESSNMNDLFKKYNEMKSLNIQNQSIDFLYFELNNKIYFDTNNYIHGLVVFLQLILTYQKENGVTIMKIDNIFYKPIVDVLYILTSLYDKVYIVKPNTTNIITNERYIVCKHFTVRKNDILINNLELLIKTLNSGRFIVHSLITDNLPIYFMNKIEDSNINIGHQQIEHLDLLLHIIKNKNREDKIETLKKSNIIKCIQWCEKFKIPHNKFIDKTNIFLPYIENSSYENNDFNFSCGDCDTLNSSI